MKFSVVIPTCHRLEGLAACLDRLAPGAQERLRPDGAAPDYEVIVTDAGTRFTAEAMLREKYPWTRWIPAAGRGPGPNRNTGAAQARGEWIAFVDDDCLPSATWLARLDARTREGNFDVVEGAITSPTLPDHPLWTAPVNTHGNAGWTANLCVRRAWFEQLRGFDPDLPETAEDMEFHLRSKRAGAAWTFAADAVVEHPPRRMTWPQFWRETLRFRWWFMFRLKTGTGPGADAGAWRGWWDVVFAVAELYARNSWHLLKRWSSGEWRGARRDGFLRARDWLLYPVLVPYFWRYAMRYRTQLRARKNA